MIGPRLPCAAATKSTHTPASYRQVRRLEEPAVSPGAPSLFRRKPAHETRHHDRRRSPALRHRARRRPTRSTTSASHRSRTRPSSRNRPAIHASSVRRRRRTIQSDLATTTSTAPAMIVHSICSAATSPGLLPMATISPSPLILEVSFALFCRTWTLNTSTSALVSQSISTLPMVVPVAIWEAAEFRLVDLDLVSSGRSASAVHSTSRARYCCRISQRHRRRRLSDLRLRPVGCQPRRPPAVSGVVGPYDRWRRVVLHRAIVRVGASRARCPCCWPGWPGSGCTTATPGGPWTGDNLPPTLAGRRGGVTDASSPVLGQRPSPAEPAAANVVALGVAAIIAWAMLAGLVWVPRFSRAPR
jgi:hypothetical protein